MYYNKKKVKTKRSGIYSKEFNLAPQKVCPFFKLLGGIL